MTFFSSIFSFALLITQLFTSSALSREVNFDEIFNDSAYSENATIPKIAHFVFTKTRPLAWLEFAAINSAIVNLQVETVNIWCAPVATFDGPIWQFVLASFPEVRIREIEMPTSIYGNPIEVPAHVSDVARLEAVYTEGGIYMDYNIIALRSSDDIINSPTTKSAVMAEQDPGGFGNAFFMAKPHSPFLKAWMQEYRRFNDSDWGGFSLVAPHKLYEQGNQDLTALDVHTWYYPYCCSDASTIKLFFGHSFTDIDENYGVHQWGGRWRTTNMLTPESVRTIDTPFFCHIRHLFNDLGDGYVAQDYRTNPNCSFVDMSTLRPSSDLLMADYQFTHDTSIKVIDDSGNRLHGWAPHTTGMPLDFSSTATSTSIIPQQVREFQPYQFLVLPLPTDYDGRVGTLQTSLYFQNGFADDRDKTTTLAQVRMDDDSKLLLRLLRSASTGNTSVQVEWIASSDRTSIEGEVFVHTSASSVFLDDGKWHGLQLSWDRKQAGLVTVLVDGNLDTAHASGEDQTPLKPLLAASVRLLPKELKGGEVWINALKESELDGGLRARMRYLRTYASAHLASWITSHYDKDKPHPGSITLGPDLAAVVNWLTSIGATTWIAIVGLLAVLIVVATKRYAKVRREWRRMMLLSPGSRSPVRRGRGRGQEMGILEDLGRYRDGEGKV